MFPDLSITLLLRLRLVTLEVSTEQITSTSNGLRYISLRTGLRFVPSLLMGLEGGAERGPTVVTW